MTGETSFQAAYRMKRKHKKTAVLNFANAVNPGGGVLYGACAQEEDICRCSNLYPCLVKPEVYEAFYRYNQMAGPYYSDRVIYSPNITVFKREGVKPEYTDDWFQVGILTCPAPNLNGILKPDYQKLEKIYRKRIRNILAVAAAHGVQALVLGAVSCGAFRNPPELVAEAFLHEFTQGEFKNTFKEIVFAIKADSQQGVHNLQVFQAVFSPWQQDAEYGSQTTVVEMGRLADRCIQEMSKQELVAYFQEKERRADWIIAALLGSAGMLIILEIILLCLLFIR